MTASGLNTFPVDPTLVNFVQNNALMFAVAVISGAMLLWPLLRKSTGGPWVSATEATQLINREDAMVVDVRDAGEFGSGHILGAKNVPLSKMDGSGELAKRKEKTVIVYCDTGDRAGKAATALRKLGFGKVFNLTGGIGGWTQAGLPVARK